jgi:ribosomal protein S18 acetylase RimI-like enzyme
MKEKDPTAAVTIRPAELSDAEVLAQLMGELGYETRASEMEMRLETILKNPSYQTLVSVSGGKVCGMIGCSAQHSYEHNNVGARILALVVSKSMRGQGVGKELVRAAENDLVAKNITRVALNTRFVREDAHKFYESLGYEKNGFRFVKTLAGTAD